MGFKKKVDPAHGNAEAALVFVSNTAKSQEKTGWERQRGWIVCAMSAVSDVRFHRDHRKSSNAVTRWRNLSNEFGAESIADDLLWSSHGLKEPCQEKKKSLDAVPKWGRSKDA